MSTPLVYQIRIKCHLDETWIDWFTPLVVVNEENGEATLTGAVLDQAELDGLLGRIFDLNLTLLAVNRIMDPSE
jgi:arginine repressor